MIPTGHARLEIRVRAWVPMDDEHTMFFGIARSAGWWCHGLPRAQQAAGRGRPTR